MRPGAVVAILLLAGGGCTGTVGPLQRPAPPVWFVADPHLTIDQQKARGREFLALPEPSANVGPRTYAEPPGYHDRPH